MWKKVLGLTLALALGLAIYFILKPRSDARTTRQKTLNESITPSLEQGRLRRSAAEPVRYKTIAENNQEQPALPDDTTENCRQNNAMLSIIEGELSVLINDAGSSGGMEMQLQKCFEDSGVSTDCLSEAKDEDEDADTSEECRSSILIARAKLIDAFYTTNPKLKPDRPVLANRIIAKLFADSNGNSMPQVFALVDLILQDDPDDMEAHRLRGLSSVISSLSDFSSDSVKAKGLESIEALKQTNEPSNVKIAHDYEYLANIQKFRDTKDKAYIDANLDLAKSELQTYPTDPYSYYRMMELEGLRGNRETALSWLDKGLAQGPSQPDYEYYAELKKKLQSGEIEASQIGVRFVSNFEPSSILKQ